jgi:N-acetylneuraminic acid mutarotase
MMLYMMLACLVLCSATSSVLAAGDKWEKIAAMPVSLALPSANVVNDKIYVIGGDKVGDVATPTVEVYYPGAGEE